MANHETKDDPFADRFTSPFIIEIGGRVVSDPDNPNLSKDAAPRFKMDDLLKRLRARKDKHRKE